MLTWELIAQYTSYNPTVTNTTACIDGFFNGWKNWCINHTVNCVKNFTLGGFPEMIITAHQQYLAGEKAANSTGIRCPIGENAAFVKGGIIIMTITAVRIVVMNMKPIRGRLRILLGVHLIS